MKKTLQTTLLASTAFALALSFAMPQAYAADEMSLRKSCNNRFPPYKNRSTA